jgi:YD repeat-containing protein
MTSCPQSSTTPSRFRSPETIRRPACGLRKPPSLAAKFSRSRSLPDRAIRPPAACHPVARPLVPDPRPGDFGHGWSLSLADIRVQKSRPLLANWKQVIGGLIGSFGIPLYQMSPDRPMTVTLTFPDNQVQRFQAVFSNPAQAGVPVLAGAIRFIPTPETRGTLEIDGPNEWKVTGNLPAFDPFTGFTLPGGRVQLVGAADPLTPEPVRFRYTSPEGLVFLLDETDGLVSVTDRNGNQVQYTSAGVFHSSGESVQFLRDGQGRVTGIVDPAGGVLNYTYDAAGDLTAFTDRAGGVTQFAYDPGRPHYLRDITDPRGIRAARVEYDADGRMIRQTDADGNDLAFAHDLPGRTETVTDRLGHVTVHVYDDRGNVTASTDPLGRTTHRTYDGFDRQLTETDPLGNTTTHTYDANDNRARGRSVHTYTQHRGTNSK